MAENNSSNSGDENQNLRSCIQDLSEKEEESLLEEKFKNRFTGEDEEFQKNTVDPNPPFVYPWDARPPRQRGNWYWFISVLLGFKLYQCKKKVSL